MAATTWAALKHKQNELIRKALDGSVFVADESAAVVAALTGTAGALQTLPTGYTDLGFLTKDGTTFGVAETNSDVTSWGQVTPTRSDVLSRDTTVKIACQETKLRTLELYTGADLSAVAPATATGGQVIIDEATRPPAKYYRLLAISVDESDDGEIYIARFLPRAKVDSIDDQKHSDGDDPILYGITFKAHTDTTLGFSVRHLFGGPGWLAMLTAMGFPAAV